jgi:hypothetical protein
MNAEAGIEVTHPEDKTLEIADKPQKLGERCGRD